MSMFEAVRTAVLLAPASEVRGALEYHLRNLLLALERIGSMRSSISSQG
jgi:hypothetical protein